MRVSEILLALYLTYTSILAFSLSLPAPQTRRILLANLCMLAIYGAALMARRLRAIELLRDWMPLAAMILCYKQMGWFFTGQYDHSLEKSWVAWDRILLYDWGLKAAIEALGPVLPSLLEICYLLVYALPAFLMLMLYIYRRRTRADLFLAIYVLSLCFSYGQFPFWPSQTPRTLFAGQDLPAYDTVFRHWVLHLLGSQGIHTSVFPSAHVSGAFAAAFAMRRLMRDRPWLRWGSLVYAALVAVATIYGRYHYTVDALAGLIMAVGADGAGAALIWMRYRWAGRVAAFLRPSIDIRLSNEKSPGNSGGGLQPRCAGAEAQEGAR